MENNLNFLQEGQTFFLASTNQTPAASMNRVGFTEALNIGETILPSIVGRASRFNAEGGYTLLRNLPKETYYQERVWEWEDWGGNHHSKIVYIPHQRFQRQPIPAPAEELTLVEIAGRPISVTKMLTYSPENHSEIKHLLNLMLELYGECEVLQNDLAAILPRDVRRLNWDVLPPGEYPFERVMARMTDMLANQSVNKRTIYLDRVTKLSALGAQLIAYGRAGFSGYLVFQSPIPGVFLLESLHYGNATYVVRNDWEAITSLSKAEILDGNHHEDRIVHGAEWQNQITQYFN